MDRKIIFASLFLAASPLMAGCMPADPRTHLDWGVNTRTPRHVASKEGAKTYTYDDSATRPSARPGPSAAPHALVTSQTLAPIGPPRSEAPAFAWPVSGRVISDFGTTSNGGKNDGINIATSMDTPIHASASGTVTYAGDELKNYGNLVLIKHADGFTTAYAHADRLVVSRGDTVTKGQVIGYAGHTGDVATPQLHFEIREQTTPVNPRSYLASTTASNN
jgi:murein DD-endopeptidase MepM/ murein hydrolase activator NlpD